MDRDSFHAKILGNKFLPTPIKTLILISVSWTLRGSVLYMDRTEKAFALFLETATILAFGVLIVRLTGLYTGLFLAFALAHTLNWMFNGQVFVLFKTLGFIRIKRRQFIEYLMALQQRIVKQRSLAAVAAFGSLSRGELKESSDIDVRIIRRSGIVNGVKACTFTLLERARAFMHGFPLDVYTLDSLKDLSKLRPDEPPIVLYDPCELLKKDKHFLSLDETITTLLVEG